MREAIRLLHKTNIKGLQFTFIIQKNNDIYCNIRLVKKIFHAGNTVIKVGHFNVLWFQEFTLIILNTQCLNIIFYEWTIRQENINTMMGVEFGILNLTANTVNVRRINQY